jgi:hypothetical protein
LIAGRRFFETKKETEASAEQEVASTTAPEETRASADATAEKEGER